MNTEANGSPVDATAEVPKPILEAATPATGLAATIEAHADIDPSAGLHSLAAEGPTDSDMAAMATRDGLLTADQYTDPKRNTENSANTTPRPEVAAETPLNAEKVAITKAEGFLSTATDSVRKDILKGMEKDGKTVELNDSGWPKDAMQAMEMHEAMANRQGEIQDRTLKLGVMDALGPAPDPNKNPQEYRKWSEEYKKGVDAALEGKNRLNKENDKSAEGLAPVAVAIDIESGKRKDKDTTDAEAKPAASEADSKKEKEGKKNTMAQAFKDATDYLLAPNEQKGKPSSAQTKEKIMAEVKAFDAKEPGYMKKFMIAQAILTVTLGLVIEGATNLEQQAKKSIEASNASSGGHA